MNLALFVTAAALAPAPRPLDGSGLAAPVQLRADGELIDTGEDIGYAGAQLRDMDGDGLPDLLVSSFRGNIRFFENVGTRAEPAFEEGDALQAEGEPIRIHNW